MSRIVFARLDDYVTGDRPTHDDVLRYASAVRRDIDIDGHLSEHIDVELDDAKTRVGVFKPRLAVISFSRLYLDHASIESIENTVLHEFAHACDYYDRGTSDHGPRWRAWCARLGMTRIERCADNDETGEMPRGKYEATCSKCGQHGLAYRWKISPIMKRRAIHNRCGGDVAWVDVNTRRQVAA